MRSSKKRRNIATTINKDYLRALEKTSGHEVITFTPSQMRDAEMTPTEFIMTLEERINTGDMKVPCNGCTACCRSGYVVDIREDDRPEDREYLTIVPRPDGGEMVAKNADWSCVHLGSSGCTVYEHRPRACRSYDCRLHSLCGVAERGSDMPRFMFSSDTVADAAIITSLRLGATMAAHKGQTNALGLCAEALVNLRKNYDGILPMVRYLRTAPKKDVEQFLEECRNVT